MRGDAGDDYIDGGAGNDLLKGSDGDDTLIGGTGSDELWGNDGDDTLAAGSGADWLKGGDGADNFLLSALGGVDTIADFSRSNGDQLDLSVVLAEPVATGSVAAASDALSNGHVQLRQDGDDTRVYLDQDGAEGGGGWTHIATLMDETAEDFEASDFIV